MDSLLRPSDNDRNPQGSNDFLRAGERPATSLICTFIAEHRARFGVVPICRVLTEHGCAIAPRTFYAWLNREPSKRALWDMTITEVLAGYYEPDEHGRRAPESLYGSTKMWAHLHREGIEVARCTVERLMRANGWQGVVRAKKVRTTEPDPGPPGLRTWWTASSRFRLPTCSLSPISPTCGCQPGVRLHRVRHRCVRRADRGLAVQRQQTHRVRGVRDPPSRELATDGW